MDTVVYQLTKMWEVMGIGLHGMSGRSTLCEMVYKQHEPITEGIIVATYGVPSAGMNVTYQYIDKTSGSGGSEINMVNQTGTMHFLGSTAELVGFYPGDNVAVSVSKCVTHRNTYGYPECIPQRIIDNKTITLGETGGIVSLDLSKSAIVMRAPSSASWVSGNEDSN